MLSREIDPLSSSVSKLHDFQNTGDGYTGIPCAMPTGFLSDTLYRWYFAALGLS